MKFKYIVACTLFFVFANPSYSSGIDGDIKCYQDGQNIFNSQGRVRAFKIIDPMTQIADISLGQVKETKVKIYASSSANVVCVVKETN